MFSEEEQKEIVKKTNLLEKVKNGDLMLQELSKLHTKKRVSWFMDNKDSVLQKYIGLPDEEKAYKIIYFDYMKINPGHCNVIKLSEGKIKIESRNFCPYLEACKKLCLDTEFICKESEPSIQQICKLINPNLKFRRNYQNIRPHADFCEEYFEIV